MLHPDSGKYEDVFGEFLEKWDRQLVRNISVIENMSIMSIHDI